MDDGDQAANSGLAGDHGLERWTETRDGIGPERPYVVGQVHVELGGVDQELHAEGVAESIDPPHLGQLGLGPLGLSRQARGDDADECREGERGRA